MLHPGRSRRAASDASLGIVRSLHRVSESARCQARSGPTSTPSLSRSSRSQRAANPSSCVTTTNAVPCWRASSSISIEDAVGGFAVEVAGRFVGEHAGRPGDQRACNRDALALASRELRRPVCDAPGQPDLRQHGLRLRACGLGRHAADAQRHRHVVEGAELGQQVVELVDEAEVAVAPVALLRRAHRGEVAPHQLRRCLASAPRARRAGAAACSCPSPTRRPPPASRPRARAGSRRAARARRGCCRGSACRARCTAAPRRAASASPGHS